MRVRPASVCAFLFSDFGQGASSRRLPRGSRCFRDRAVSRARDRTRSVASRMGIAFGPGSWFLASVSYPVFLITSRHLASSARKNSANSPGPRTTTANPFFFMNCRKSSEAAISVSLAPRKVAISAGVFLGSTIPRQPSEARTPW